MATAGSAFEFETTLTLPGGDQPAVCKLSDTKALVGYLETGDNAGNVRVLNISGDTVTGGARYGFATGTYAVSSDEQFYLAALDSSTAMVAWVDNNDANLYGRILNISGDTITLNAVQTITTSVTKVGLTALSSTRALVAYRDVSPDDLMGRVLDISGATITANAAVTIDTTNFTGVIGLEKLASDKAVIVNGRATANSHRIRVLHSISTTFTVGTSVEVMAVNPTGYPHQVKALSSTFGVVTFQDNSPADSYCVSFTISGNTVSVGNLLDVNTVLGAAGVFLDTSRGLVVYRSDATTVTIDDLSIDGTTLSLGGSTEDIETGAVTVYAFDIIPIGSDKALIVYPGGSPTVGKARIITSGLTAAAGKFFFAATGEALAEKFTLPFSGVHPKAMTLRASLGTVVLASKSAASSVAVYSDYPYPTGTATDNGLPTGTTITAVRWI